MSASAAAVARTRRAGACTCVETRRWRAATTARQGIYAYVTLLENVEPSDELRKELIASVRISDAEAHPAYKIEAAANKVGAEAPLGV